jgi:ATP-binding cassette subfamily B protein
VSRRWLIPEVIQTSAMDCGPACLTALLAGHRVRASYERLREACRTDVDGTSIDTIEEAALQLGLQAEQNIVPVDHVLRPEASALPAIVITRQPDGGNHFVVIWNQIGGQVQVMDPAVGRRWIPRKRLLEELYVHEMELPAELWREWAGTDDRKRPLIERLRALGVVDPAARVDVALGDPTWRSVATLDAATRLVQRLVDAGAMRSGAETAALVGALVDDPAGIPDDAWAAAATADPATVRVRGAVIVRVTGFTAVTPASPELRAALDEPAPRPWRHLIAAALSGGRLGPAGIVAVIALTALLVVVQAALWRALFDTHELTTLQLGGALATLVAFLAIELLIEASVVGANHRLGRRIELGLRAQFLASIARLGLRYLQSRPISDLTERSHALHRLRELPWIGAQLVRVALTTLLTGAALIWLAPETRWLVVGLALSVIVPPLLGHGPLAERELRVRTHHGAITRFFLDALLGAVPARAHGVERALRREHEGRLVEWARAALREHAFGSALVALQTALVCGFAVALVALHVASTDRPASVLLAVYWTLMMATSAGAFTALIRELPAAKNLTLRLLEPLGARGDGEAPGAAAVDLRAGPLCFDDVSVVAGGHPVLAGVSLTIPVGQHVAIVGASGAGKSTLIGLLLGWHRAATGTVRLGDVGLDATTIDALRRRTAWVDPSVQLWNDSLVHNLTFGVDGAVGLDLGATAVQAQLDDVLGRLPEGMQTRLGEGGGLLSGGEGQRVRFGRGLARRDVALVLLDEPFRGIDRDRRRALMATARERWRGVTVLCATHDLTETLGFDRVLVVAGGRVVEDDAPTVLAAREGSCFAQLLADEAAAHEQWARWRVVRLEGGRAVEVPR